MWQIWLTKVIAKKSKMISKGVAPMKDFFKKNTRGGLFVFGSWGGSWALFANVLLGIFLYTVALRFKIPESIIAFVGILTFFLVNSRFFPLFTGRKFIKIGIGAALVVAFFWALWANFMVVKNFFAELDLKAVGESNASRVYFVKAGTKLYKNKDDKNPILLDSDKEVFYLNERTSDPKRETLMKVRIQTSSGDKEYWIPYRSSRKLKEVKNPSPPAPAGGSRTSGVSGAAIAASKPSGGLVVELSPSQIIAQDLYGDSGDKTRLLVSGFKKGDIVEFLEDFEISTRNRTQGTVLFADARRVKSLPGNVIHAGTRFQVRGDSSPGGVDLMFSSNGVEQVGFSKLRLAKVN